MLIILYPSTLFSSCKCKYASIIRCLFRWLRHGSVDDCRVLCVTHIMPIKMQTAESESESGERKKKWRKYLFAASVGSNTQRLLKNGFKPRNLNINVVIKSKWYLTHAQPPQLDKCVMGAFAMPTTPIIIVDLVARVSAHKCLNGVARVRDWA